MASKRTLVLRRDDVGWFVGLMLNNGTYAVRTLSTRSRARAERWLAHIREYGEFRGHARV